MKHVHLPFILSFCLAFSLLAQTDPTPAVVDDDNDGLIEIWNLTQLDHMRHDLDGSHYKPGAGGTATNAGCPGGG